MKVFFTASPRGKEEFGKFYDLIYKTLTTLKYEHVDNDLHDQTYSDFQDQMGEGRAAHVEWYRKKVDGMQSADICIFETSIHSLGIGFLIQRAFDYGKPTIVLHYKDNIPYFLSGVEDDKLIVANYDEHTLPKVIQDMIAIAREKRDKRFNFFLSPKLLNYIEDASNKQGVTKSKLLRDMIVRHMREHLANDKDDK